MSFTPIVFAAFQRGTASVDLHWVKVSTSPSFTFTYNNPAGSDPALCIRIDRPNTSFTLTSGSSSGWVESHTSSQINFTGGSIPAGGNASFIITTDATTNSVQSAWSVWGSKNASCSPPSKADASSSGALDTGIDGAAPVNNGINSVTANSSSQITVVANAASDAGSGLNSSPYYFEETTGTGHNSGWQASTTYVDTGLSPNTTYSYRLMVRDVFDNQSGWSGSSPGSASANTPSGGSFSSVGHNSITVSWSSSSNPAGTEYYAENTTNSTDSGWITAISWNSTGLSGNTTYAYRVKARNSAQSETGWHDIGSQSTLTPTATPTPPTPTPIETATPTPPTLAPIETATPTPSPPPPVPGTIPVEPVPEPVGPASSAPAVAPELPAGDIGAPNATTADLSILGGTTSLQPIESTPGDTDPPVIEVVEKPDSIIKDSVFSLTANTTDTRGVIEFLAYSIDGGKSWQPVTIADKSQIGTAKVTFLVNSFRLSDGNYEILLKARDNSENEVVISAGVVIIDVEQPQIISLLVRSGSLEIPSTTAKEITLSAKLDFEIAGAFGGGVTGGKIVIGGKDYNFSYHKEKNNWTSKINIDSAGHQKAYVKLFDGANNRLDEEIFDFNVTPPFSIGTKNDYEITIFEFNYQNDAWQVFNAKTYQKDNPDQADSVDKEGVILPAGKYYIKSGKIKNQNFLSKLLSYFSDAFTIDDTQSLSGDVKNISSSKPEDGFDYPNVNSAKVLDDMPTVKNQLLSLRGNDIILFNLDPRSFVSLEQLSVISEVKKENPEIKIFVTTNKYYLEYCKQMLQRGHYQVELISNDDNYFYKDTFKYRSPGFIFINRRGEVKMIKIEYLTQQEIINIMGGI